ncbi:hypothetical protein DSO57_1006925 [Entomophthora muscae]|uniref:Uncharacterized protein n=1 Tax=Entomophthora muscae TaxID=34485 RepID=A0ACC2SWQ0_9FUNG|nr:hypothetical protein DSO57_1006925 [Entomophthora muscae]
MSLVVYNSVYYIPIYFAGNFGHYNVLVKVVCWVMTIHLIVKALTRYHFTNLLPYMAQSFNF